MALFNSGNNEELENLKKSMLRKFPSLGTVASGLKYKYSKKVPTAETDGNTVWANPNFMNSLSHDEQVFIMSHETMHVAFDHIKRAKNRDGEFKDSSTWNIATDAVINQMLKAEGLPMPQGCIDKPEAIDKSAEEMYKVLYERKQQRKAERQKRREEQQKQEQSGGQGQEGESQEQENNDQQGQNKQNQKGQKGQNQQNKDQEGQESEQEEQEGQGKGQKGKQNDKKNQKGQGSESEESDEDDSENQNEKGKDQKKDKSKGQSGDKNDSDDEDSDDLDDDNSDGKQGKDKNKSKSKGQSGDEDEEDSENDSDGQSSSGQKGNKSKSSQGNQGNQNDNDYDDEMPQSQNIDPDDFDDDELEANQKATANHSGWKKALEKMEKRQEKEKKKKEKGKDYEKLEKEFKEKNRELKKKMAEAIRRKINERTYECGHGTSSVYDSFGNLGEAEKAVVPWQKVLKKNFERTEYRWSDRRANRSNGYSSRVTELTDYENPATEVILDTSGSIDDRLLRGFLRQVKTILKQAYGKNGGKREIKLKVGCFDDYFHGFTEIKTLEDIDRYHFVGRGGTSIDSAVQAFTKDKKVNKIIFTDGYDGDFPKRDYSNVNCIYVIFDNPNFKAKNGTTIHVESNDVYMDSMNMLTKSTIYSDDEDELY